MPGATRAPSSLRLDPDQPEVALAEEQVVEDVAQAVDLVGEPALILGQAGEVDLGQALVVGEGVQVDAVDRLVCSRTGWSVRAELERDDAASRFESTEIAQPALFAVQVGLTRMLLGAGIAPTVVLGHSVGEVAAAWASGALALDQAVEVICKRSTEQGRTRGAAGTNSVSSRPRMRPTRDAD